MLNSILTALQGLGEGAQYLFLTVGGWKNFIMLVIAGVMFFLAVAKDVEPLLLLPGGTRLCIHLLGEFVRRLSQCLGLRRNGVLVVAFDRLLKIVGRRLDLALRGSARRVPKSATWHGPRRRRGARVQARFGGSISSARR